MGHQVIAASFRIQQFVSPPNAIPRNVGDTTQFSASWTPGATIIDPIAIQEPLSQRWSLLSWSIAFTPYVQTGFGTNQMYGKLGRIMGGIVRQTPTPLANDGFLTPWVTPMRPLPTNAAGIATMWDAASDPALPNVVTNLDAKLTPVTFQYQLPVPIELYPGEDFQIGVWITPSLAQNASVSVTNASYSVIYDDNQPQTATWGG